MGRSVAITGVGAVTPLGMGARTLFERWAAGQVGIVDGEAPCSDFDAVAVLGNKTARRADRFAQFALAASDEALADAGWLAPAADAGPTGNTPAGGAESAPDALPYAPDRIGCVIGTGIGGIGTIEAQQDVLRDRGAKRVSPLSVPLLMSNAAAGMVAMRHSLQGHSYGVVSACAAGAHAIGTAVRMIQAGDADAVVTGGSEAALTGLARAGFASMGATSELGVSRPFDARRDGFVMGEGAGVLVLEDLEAALARGARVLGTVLGYGASSDAFHLTAPDPEGRGAVRAIRLALADADVSPDELDYVNAHGTSTPLNDRAETMALKTALGEAAFGVPISSTKSAVGHLLGAAGAVEAIATVLALRERLAPPTLGFSEREEGLDLDYVPDSARPLASANRFTAAGNGTAHAGSAAAGPSAVGNGSAHADPTGSGSTTAGSAPNGSGSATATRGSVATAGSATNGPHRPAIGMSNSFGFGGHNAVLILAAA
jgi:3-oxoacyl-[acyl-carrier-protein] synthase II